VISFSNLEHSINFTIAEEVRVSLIELLELCLETDNSEFVTQLGPLCTMLGKATQDQNPEMKNICAKFCGKLATTLGKRVGGYMKTIVEALVTNLQHQHSKVRKETLRGLKDVLACKGAEPYLTGGPIAQLKFS
jgi:hypothetical protein